MEQKSCKENEERDRGKGHQEKCVRRGRSTVASPFPSTAVGMGCWWCSPHWVFLNTYKLPCKQMLAVAGVGRVIPVLSCCHGS